jgi:uncharacterized protein involved in exopolysaccharide biosynthesis
MAGLFLALWKRRVPLAVVWLAVMAVVVVRLARMDDTYTSSCVLTPLPLEQVRGSGDAGLGPTSVRSLLSSGSSRDDYAVAAFLQSRRLMDEVIGQADLKKKLFSDRWDAKAGEWLPSSGGEPTLSEARRVLDPRVDVDYDEFTRLLLLEVHWPTPEGARDVAAAHIDAADRLLREAAVAEGERRVEELERQMTASPIAGVSSYLAEEMTAAISSLSSIRARSNYAFRVIDPPSVPDRRSWPPRLTLFVLAALATAGVEIGVVWGHRYGRSAVGPRSLDPTDVDDRF